MRVGSVLVLLIDEVANADSRQAGDHKEDAKPAEPVSVKEKVSFIELNELACLVESFDVKLILYLTFQK